MKKKRIDNDTPFLEGSANHNAVALMTTADSAPLLFYGSLKPVRTSHPALFS
ncbi:MAG: hypothetical protein ACR2PT_05485 [Endozoicomonas sp.]